MDTTLAEPAEAASKDLAERPEHPFTYAGDGPRAWSAPMTINGLASWLGMTQGDFATVSAGDALRQGAVIACLDIMAQDVASAPPTLNRVLTQGSRRRGYELIAPREHPIAALFWVRPNDFMTWNEFTTMLVYHLGLVNNAYVIPVKDRMLRTTALIPVIPTRVRQDVDRNTGRFIYRVQAANLAEAAIYGGEDELIFFADEIIHIKTRTVNGFSGLSTLNLGNRVLALTEAVARFQDRLFRRDGMQRGTFQTKETGLTQDQYNRLKSSLQEALGMMRDMGFPLILEAGMEFKSMSMTAAEAGSKEAWGQQIAETARLFGIPPYKIQHFDGVKYDNMEPLERNYVSILIRKLCMPIEERLNFHLLSDDEQMDYYVEFDRKALHQGDQKALNERVTKQWDAGLITQNEAREELGHNPAKNGDVYKMAANTFLIDGDHKVIVTNQASPGDPPVPKNDGE